MSNDILLLISIIGLAIFFPLTIAFFFYIYSKSSQDLEESSDVAQKKKNYINFLDFESFGLYFLASLIHSLKNFHNYKKYWFMFTLSLILSFVFGYFVRKYL